MESKKFKSSGVEPIDKNTQDLMYLPGRLVLLPEITSHFFLDLHIKANSDF